MIATIEARSGAKNDPNTPRTPATRLTIASSDVSGGRPVGGGGADHDGFPFLVTEGLGVGRRISTKSVKALGGAAQGLVILT